jgi:hypothetical protein
VVFVALTMLVCLLLSAAVAAYVAYPARGRPLPSYLARLRVAPARGGSRRPRAGRSRLPGAYERARG